MEAKLYPWDLEEISPGWSCPVGELEVIVQARRETTPYRRGVLALRTKLAKDLYDRDGVLYTVREVDGALCVLTPQQAILSTAKELQRDRQRERRRIGEVTFALMDPALPQDVRDKGQQVLTISNAHRAAERGARAAIRRVLKSKQPKQLGESPDAE